METFKKSYWVAVFTFVAVIVISAVCVNHFVDNDFQNIESEINEFQGLHPESGTTSTAEADSDESISAKFTDKTGKGQISLDMSFDDVKAVLDKAAVSYNANELTIDTKDGTTYLFWSNGKETRVNSVILSSAAEGLEVGDLVKEMEKIYGEQKFFEKDGVQCYCYVTDGVQLAITAENNKVVGISISYVNLNYPENAKYEADKPFSGVYTPPIASDYNHQKPLKYTTETGKKECFVQIAESQVGYTNGFLNEQNIEFPLSQNNGWSKYGSSAGAPIGPWSALFISWCADRADISEEVFERSSTADMNWKYFNERSSYIPERGDLIYFKYNGFNNPVAYANHVGIVVDYIPVSKTIITVEGDTKGGQCVKKAYRLNDSTNEITGYSSISF